MDKKHTSVVPDKNVFFVLSYIPEALLITFKTKYATVKGGGNMLKKLMKLFLTKETGKKYRALLLDVTADEITEGYLKFELSYILIKEKTKDVSHFVDSFADDGRDMHAKTFFDFLKKSGIKFENYFELAGSVFDVEIATDGNGSQYLRYLRSIA